MRNTRKNNWHSHINLSNEKRWRANGNELSENNQSQNVDIELNEKRL